MSVLRI